MSTWTQVVLILLLVSGLLVACTRATVQSEAGAEPAADPLQVDAQQRRVSIPATLELEAFAGGDPPGHHLVTWGGGRAGGKALLRTPVSDADVLDALERLGGKPGDTLTAASWDHREDPERPEPDARAEGSRVEIMCTLPDGREVPIDALLEDLDGNGFAWVLAGNRGLIPVWKSGCVVCLQSCPGSKVANRNATIRDLALGRSRFEPSPLARSLGSSASLIVHLTLVD